MPVIRQYGPQVETRVTEQAPLDDRASRFEARAQQQLGQAVQSLGGALLGIAERQEVSDVSNKLAETKRRLTSEFQQELANANPADKTFSERFSKKVDEAYSQVGEGIVSGAARRYYQENSTRARLNFTDSAARGQAQLAGIKAVDDYKGVVNNLSSATVMAPGELDDKIADLNLDLAARQDIDAKMKVQLKSEGESLLAESSVRGWLRSSPEKAKELLEQGFYDQYIDGKKKARLLKEADSTIQTNKNFSVNRQETLNSLKRNNPYKWARQKEVNIKYKPLDFDDPLAFREREKFRNRMRAQGTNPPLLDEAEAFEVQNTLESGDVLGQTSMLRRLNENMLKEQYNDFSSQMFARNPALGAALGVSDEDIETANQILVGNSILKKDKSFKMEVTDQEIRDDYNAYLGDAIGPENVEFRNQNFQAVKSIMAQAQAAGEPLEAQEATEKLFGPVFDLNGKKVLSFRGKDGQFVEDDYFEEIIEETDLETMEKKLGDIPRKADGSPVDKNDLEDVMYYIPVSDGKYKLQLGGDFAKDKNGNDYILDMKKLESTFVREPGFF